MGLDGKNHGITSNGHDIEWDGKFTERSPMKKVERKFSGIWMGPNDTYINISPTIINYLD